VAAEGQLPSLLQPCSRPPRRRGRLLFPALRAADPSIGPVVDRLEADHSRVSDLLDDVEAAARALTNTDGDGDGDDARLRVIEGLQELHVHLLEHLDYEELNAGPTMRRLDRLF
jgi:hemerythrin-like domain-containing protein